jgi:hypothetical protein
MDPFVARSGPRVAAALALLVALALAALVAPACGGGKSSPALTADPSGTPDAGTVVSEAPPDAGTQAPPDAGPKFGGPGPWPIENRTFGAADGIDDLPVVAVSTDETQNLWVAGPHSLFVMKPGDAKFTKFTSRDGLHLADNPVLYHETYCGSTATVRGAADGRGINTIVGGAANEVFVGYWGADEMSGTCADPPEARHSGKIDRVRLGADGKLTVDRFDLAAINIGMNFWHNRTVLRMVYDHVIHPHTLYAGTNHGVDMLLPDKWRLPAKDEWIDVSQKEWMADHLHVAPCFPNPCPIGSEGPQRIGWWQGLALAPDGDVWHAGRWAAGKIRWAADPLAWEQRAGHEAFDEAFGDPYPGIPPVFFPNSCDYGATACQELEGLVVSLTAVSAAADGTAWFASGRVFGSGSRLGSDEPLHYFGIASYKRGKGFKYYSYSDVGVPQGNAQDLVALPNGQIVVAGGGTGLSFFDPATGKHVNVRAGQGIPNDRVLQMEVDTMVDPPALHVATAGGAAVIRVFPTIQ